ncbi:hypothetical protein K439DRAFT_1614766 [Ramaria rubella]|nr:hypothetical protein K439DRAFT_1614766 [Ramaria rubella]
MHQPQSTPLHDGEAPRERHPRVTFIPQFYFDSRNGHALDLEQSIQPRDAVRIRHQPYCSPPEPIPWHSKPLGTKRQPQATSRPRKRALLKLTHRHIVPLSPPSPLPNRAYYPFAHLQEEFDILEARSPAEMDRRELLGLNSLPEPNMNRSIHLRPTWEDIIKAAILGSPSLKLTQAEIREAVKARFPFEGGYTRRQCKNLSEKLRRYGIFQKVKRPTALPGNTGNWWEVATNPSNAITLSLSSSPLPVKREPVPNAVVRHDMFPTLPPFSEFLKALSWRPIDVPTFILDNTLCLSPLSASPLPTWTCLESEDGSLQSFSRSEIVSTSSNLQVGTDDTYLGDFESQFPGSRDEAEGQRPYPQDTQEPCPSTSNLVIE